jgi:hypothetical protein
MRIRIAKPGELTVQGEPIVRFANVVRLVCSDCGENLVSVDADVDFTNVPPNLHLTFLQMLTGCIHRIALPGGHSNCPKAEEIRQRKLE